MTEPTKCQVLTNHEIIAAWNSEAGFPEALRAVEQAVLAKLRMGGCHFVDGQPCVSAAEARELERKAFLVGWTGDNQEHQAVMLGSLSFNETRDRLYPSLTAPKPKDVTLASGERWIKLFGDAGWNGISPGRVRFAHVPDCRTPEDFEKVARYLREMAP